MTKQHIRLGHSPDPDDAFMFYGLACGAVDSGPFEFEHILQDIQTLNEWAKETKLEITAVSVHAYAYIQDQYAMLSSGASMGATELVNYVPDADQSQIHFEKSIPTNVHGPLLVAKESITPANLEGKIIAVPGTLTTAFLVLNLAIGRFQFEVVPFDQILDAVETGAADAGLIIHEGQLTFARQGLHCLMDLGQWWFEQTGLPLPLGCNVIRRDLGDKTMMQISKRLNQSIEYGLNHRDQAVRYAMDFGQGLDLQQADAFVGMYVNEWTLNYGPLGRQAVNTLLQQAFEAGYLPSYSPVDFI